MYLRPLQPHASHLRRVPDAAGSLSYYRAVPSILVQLLAHPPRQVAWARQSKRGRLAEIARKSWPLRPQRIAQAQPALLLDRFHFELRPPCEAAAAAGLIQKWHSLTQVDDLSSSCTRRLTEPWPGKGSCEEEGVELQASAQLQHEHVEPVSDSV